MESKALHDLTDAQKMEVAVVTRMHEIFAETHPGLNWLDAPEITKQAARTEAETELDTPGKRLAFFGGNTGRRA